MKRLILLTACLIFISPLFAAFNSLGIPDSSEIRSKLQEEWFEASLETVRGKPAETYFGNTGEEFQVRMEESESTFNIFVSPHAVIQVNVVTDKYSYTDSQDVYPGDAPGSWVLVRDKSNGKPLRIRYYFLKNSEVYVQFSPSSNSKTAVSDLVIFNNYAARGVPTGIPFEKFYSASFEDIMNYTKGKLPWNYVLADKDKYINVRQMVNVIRSKLSKIKYLSNAVYDEDNNLVDIFSGKEIPAEEIEKNKLMLSSWGFLKWIADGLVEPVSNGRLKRLPLLATTVEVKENGHLGTMSREFNLFFALDWIRNLASGVISVYSGTTYKPNQSGVDVTINPFASSITEKGVSNTVTFIENSGYVIPNLKAVLYVLASTEPGSFYFAALRETDRTVTPEVKVFNQCLVLFPYFKDDGSFACVVFKDGREISLEEFCKVYSEDYIYLTRVKASDRFYPESLN